MKLTAPSQGVIATGVGSAAFPLVDTSTTAYHNVLTLGNRQSFTWEGNDSTGLRNGTNAQTFSVYNTYTAGTPDYERLEMFWSSNVAIIRQAANGTGSARSVQLRYGNSTNVALQIGTSQSGGIQIDPSGGTTARTLGAIRVGAAGNYSATSGTNIGILFDMALIDSGTNSTTVDNLISFSPTINYTGATRTGKVNLIYLAPTLTSNPTGLNAGIAFSSALNAGATFPALRFFNASDEVTNYEEVSVGFASNIFAITASKGGSGTLRGLRFGATGNSIGFYGTAPVALQTGVAVTAAGIHAALVNLGLITA